MLFPVQQHLTPNRKQYNEKAKLMIARNAETSGAFIPKLVRNAWFSHTNEV